MEMVLSNLEKDEKLGGNLKKALKLAYSVPPGNNKQNVTVALAIFHGTITAAMKSYFQDLLDAANLVMLQYSMIANQNSFLTLLTGSNHGLNVHTLIKQTSHALITTLEGLN